MLSVDTISERLQYYDCIRLIGVSAQGYHGVFTSEKANGQTFVVDADLYVDTAAAGRSDDLADTVDYSQASQLIVDIITGDPVDLLEHLVARLAQALRELPGVRAVRVCLHKPQAPLLVDFEDVTLTIWRGLEDLANPASAEFISEVSSAPAAPAKVVLSLGGNLGPVVKTFRQVIAALENDSRIEVEKVSPLLRTQAVLAAGQSPQPEYYNAVVVVHTTCAPLELLQLTQKLEQDFGRVREQIWGARTIDIDIIDYSRVRSEEPELTLPHPRAHERAFVLLPWSLIEPGAKLAGHGEIVLLAEMAPDRDGVREIYSDWYREPAALPACGTGEIPLPRWSHAMLAKPVIIDEGVTGEEDNPEGVAEVEDNDGSLLADYQEFLASISEASESELGVEPEDSTGNVEQTIDTAPELASIQEVFITQEADSTQNENTVKEATITPHESVDYLAYEQDSVVGSELETQLESDIEDEAEAGPEPETYFESNEEAEPETYFAPDREDESGSEAETNFEAETVSVWQKLKHYFSFKPSSASVSAVQMDKLIPERKTKHYDPSSFSGDYESYWDLKEESYPDPVGEEKPKWNSLYSVEEEQEEKYRIASDIGEYDPSWRPIDELKTERDISQEIAEVAAADNAENPDSTISESYSLDSATVDSVSVEADDTEVNSSINPVEAEENPAVFPSRRHRGTRAITGEIPVVPQVSAPKSLDFTAVDLEKLQQKLALQNQDSDPGDRETSFTKRRSIMRPCTTGSIPVIKSDINPMAHTATFKANDEGHNAAENSAIFAELYEYEQRKGENE